MVSVVIPVKTGIQNPSESLDSGSPPAFAGVARNDVEFLRVHFPQLAAFSQRPIRILDPGLKHSGADSLLQPFVG
jgi:hypothetical protein